MIIPTFRKWKRKGFLSWKESLMLTILWYSLKKICKSPKNLKNPKKYSNKQTNHEIQKKIKISCQTNHQEICQIWNKLPQKSNVWSPGVLRKAREEC